MKPTLQLRLSQHLAMTPQLQQSIRLLQLSTLDLEQEIERLLADNPVLERDEDGTYGSSSGDTVLSSPANEQEVAVPDEDWDSGAASAGGQEADSGEGRDLSTPDAPSLRDHLYGQLSLMNLGARDRALIAALIDALDGDGYLTMSLDEIAAILLAEVPVDTEELAVALRHLQCFDPTGVGARSPAECLAIQLRARAPGGARNEAVRRVALDIVEHHLPLLASRDYARLKSAAGANDEMLRAAQQLIRGLNPHPGASFASVVAGYVIPDVVVRKLRNNWRVSLNPEAMPRLRINRLYAELGQGARGTMGGKIQEARWLIKNIQQRFETILRVAQAIVGRQRQFFDYGEVAMRPLVLREIADELELHESTVSRVTTQKYMATPRGTFELKYFFGSHVATETGGAASSTAIRAMIKQVVAGENTRAPLSDARISQILGQQGIVVARRTVAKYRELLQIPPVKQRRSL